MFLVFLWLPLADPIEFPASVAEKDRRLLRSAGAIIWKAGPKQRTYRARIRPSSERFNRMCFGNRAAGWKRGVLWNGAKRRSEGTPGLGMRIGPPFPWADHELKRATNQSVAAVARIRRVVSFNIEYCDVSAPGFGDLVGMRSLRELRAGGTNLRDPAMAKLAKLRKLTLLTINDTSVSAKGLAHLAALKRLKTLSLGGVQGASRSLEHLVPLKKLRELHLHGTDVANKDCPAIAKLRNLRSLGLGRTSVTATGVEELTSMRLKTLDLSDTACGDRCAQSLSKMRSLRVLRLNGTRLGPKGLFALARLKKLKVLEIHRTKVTTKAVKEFQKLRPDVLVHRRIVFRHLRCSSTP